MKPGAQPRRVDYYHDPGAPSPTSMPVTVCVIVIDDQDRLLMIERTDNGAIALPSGAVDLGEQVPAAAVRECAEETGYCIELTDLVGTFSDPGVVVEYRTESYEVRQECSIMFAGRVLSGEATPSSESRTVRWVHPDDLDDLLVAPAMQYRISTYLSGAWPHFG